MKPRYVVYLRRGKAPDAAALGRAVGLSRADADRIVRARSPQPAATCASAEESGDLIGNLRAEGLDAFAITAQALARFAPAVLRRGERAAGGILWTAPDGDFLLGPADLRLIVLARVRDEARFEGRLGDDYVATTDASEYGALVLFRDAGTAWVAAQGVTELTRVLNGPPPPNSDQSFLAAVRAVRAAHPGAAFDDSLYKAPPSMRSLGSTFGAWSDGEDLGTSALSASTSAAVAIRLAVVVYLQTLGA